MLDLIALPVSEILGVVDAAADPGAATHRAAAVTQDEVLTILPVALVVLTALAVILADLFWPRREHLVMAVGLGGLLLALVATLAIGPLPGVAGALPDGGSIGDPAVYSRDLLTVLLDVTLIAIGLLTLLFAPDYLAPRGLPIAELAATLIFAISGGMLIAGGQDLLVLFIGLELLVLPGYLMAAFAKRDALSTEGAIKYFLLGSFSSAILLFGLVFVLGFTGSTQLQGIADALAGVFDGSQALPLALAMGLALVSVGLLFKIAAVPFHYWTPDAYQGSPTPVTGYLSVGPKIAAFALILRIFVEALEPLRGEWAAIVALLAIVTMTVGNLAALGQDNIKRMLAYSSIAHTGYIMVGLVVFATAEDPAVASTGIQGVLFYAVAYTFMNLGAFAVVAALQRRPGVTSQIATFAGLGFRAPVLALTMTVFLLSLTGHPAAGRLLRQGHRHPRRPRGGRHDQLAGGHHDDQRGRGGLLLPARRRLHVHASTRRRGAASERGRLHARGPRDSGDPDDLHRPRARGHAGRAGVDRGGSGGAGALRLRAGGVLAVMPCPITSGGGLRAHDAGARHAGSQARADSPSAGRCRRQDRQETSGLCG